MIVEESLGEAWRDLDVHPFRFSPECIPLHLQDTGSISWLSSHTPDVSVVFLGTSYQSLYVCQALVATGLRCRREAVLSKQQLNAGRRQQHHVLHARQ